MRTGLGREKKKGGAPGEQSTAEPEQAEGVHMLGVKDIEKGRKGQNLIGILPMPSA